MNRMAIFLVSVSLAVLSAGTASADTLESLSRRGDPTGYKHFLMGLERLKRGQLRFAIAEFQYCVRHAHLSGCGRVVDQSHFYSGVAYQRLGEDLKALREFQAAYTVNPGLFQAWFRAGKVHRGLGNLEQALLHFQRVVALKPDYGFGHYYLALTYYDRKDYAQAWKHARLAQRHGVKRTALIEKLKRVSKEPSPAGAAEKAADRK